MLDPETGTGEIRERLRVLAGAAAVGWVVAGIGDGVLGRLAMRLLVPTSDDGLAGSITDDEAKVDQSTFRGSAGAAIWGTLVWSVAGPGVFDPKGFDFTQLSPRWLGVLLFSVIFLGIGALIALGVERAIVRWPGKRLALLPMLLVGPMFPVLAARS